MELNKKRETDITKLRRELEEQASQHEQSVNSMRAKQNAALQELQEDLDALKKTKSKWVFSCYRGDDKKGSNLFHGDFPIFATNRSFNSVFQNREGEERSAEWQWWTCGKPRDTGKTEGSVAS